MQATYHAAHIVLNQSVDMLAATLEGLPDKAVQWTPIAGVSSLAVLVTHAISSTRFTLAASVGESGSREEYLNAERPAAFRTKAATVAELRESIDAARAEFRALLERGTDATLAADVTWPDVSEQPLSTAELLFRAIGHIREHVGHAQLMRDFWLSGSREGR